MQNDSAYLIIDFAILENNELSSTPLKYRQNLLAYKMRQS